MTRFLEYLGRNPLVGMALVAVCAAGGQFLGAMPASQARAGSLRPQPPSAFSQSAIPIAMENRNAR